MENKNKREMYSKKAYQAMMKCAKTQSAVAKKVSKNSGKKGK